MSNSKDHNILYISGMFAGGWAWDRTTELMPECEHHVSQSALCEVGSSLNELTEETILQLKKIGKKATVVGNSLGGLVALRTAIAEPDLVERVVISGSAGFGRVDLDVKRTRNIDATWMKSVITQLFYDDSTIDEPDFDKLTKVFSDRSSFINIMKLSRESNNTNASELIPKLQCPLMAIWGDSDNVTPISLCQPVLESQNIELEPIQQCGHSPMYERPQQFVNTIERFLTA